MEVKHHVVQHGEWLLQIARDYGVEFEALLMANAIPSANAIYPGQVLHVPVPQISPGPGNDDRLRATLGVRTAEGDLNATFQRFIDELGRTPPFYRWTISHKDYDTASSNAWATFVDSTPWGYTHKFPTVSGSIALPLICGDGMSVEQRNEQLQLTKSGARDGWWHSQIFDRLDQAPVGPAGPTHRFCLAWEPELSWAHSFVDVDIELWKAAYAHVAGMIHDAGHLVVYSGDGPFMNPAAHDPEWWEYGLPPLTSFDLFGCDLYWGGETDDGTLALGRFQKAQEIAVDLGKPVCFPEYGVERTGTYGAGRSDAIVVAWFNDVWDIMASFPATGPGSLDHHCIWHTAKAGTGDWRLTPAVMDAVVERLGA